LGFGMTLRFHFFGLKVTKIFLVLIKSVY
jgi:hypothetical protein